MLPAKINQMRFWYSQYLGTEDVVNADGKRTGEKRIKRSAPIECYGCWSASGGTGTAGFNKTKYEDYGEKKHFDYVISITPLPSWDIGEAGVVWGDPMHPFANATAPVKKQDGTFSRPWEFEVKRISYSQHTVTLAVRSVETA